MPFDPSTAAALQAALVAKCDGGQFSLTVTPNPLQQYLPTALVAPGFKPQTANVVFVAWRGTYKGTVWGEQLVCDAGASALAQAALLQSATDILAAVDLRRLTYGFGSFGIP